MISQRTRHLNLSHRYEMETHDHALKTIFNMTTNDDSSTVRTKLADNSTSKFVNSSRETVIVTATLGLIGVIILAMLCGLHHFFKRKRQMMVMPIISSSVPVLDYFMKPKEPMVFDNELSGHSLKPEGVLYWHRPLQPVTTDTDMYHIVLWWVCCTHALTGSPKNHFSKRLVYQTLNIYYENLEYKATFLYLMFHVLYQDDCKALLFLVRQLWHDQRTPAVFLRLLLIRWNSILPTNSSLLTTTWPEVPIYGN